MGWYSGSRSRAALIAELTGDRVRRDYVCLRHCTSGNVLWSVWGPRGVDKPEPDQCFIECNLMQRFGYEWGYKSFGESEHPYQYSCPPAYLEMAAPRSESWRNKVRIYWDNRRKHNEFQRKLKAAAKKQREKQRSA